MVETSELGRITARVIVKREKMSDNKLYGVINSVIVGIDSVFWHNGRWYKVVSIDTRDEDKVMLLLKSQDYDTTKPTMAKELNLTAVGLSQRCPFSTPNHRETLQKFLNRGGTIFKCEPGVASGAVGMFDWEK